MGLMSIRGNRLDDIQGQIWYPDTVGNRTEAARIFSQPGFSALYDTVLGQTDSIVEIFQLNKAIRGDRGVKEYISADRAGIAARMDDELYQIHLPIHSYPFDISSMAVKEVLLPLDETDPYKYGPFAGRVAVAKAIQAHLLIPEQS